MSADRDHSYGLSPEADEAWDRFEDAWAPGQSPRIEDYLNDLKEEERRPLFSKLLKSDLERRRDLGELPDPGEYAKRFPMYASSVEAAFRETLDPTTLARGESRTVAVGDLMSYFGDYEIAEVLGQGGMGVVYRAKQMSLNRTVALKVLRSRNVVDAQRFRFQLDAEAAAQLDHPGIVPIYEAGEHDGFPYFSMKLVEGGSLHDQLDRFKNEPRKAARLIADAASAVAHAHSRGILHRDLKPANILIDEQEHPIIADFGLAKRAEEDVGMTGTKEVFGTPAYMAPEVLTKGAKSAMAATDVYGLGATLYALQTGRAPFEGESIDAVLEQVRKSEPAHPSVVNPKVPRDLETICLKAMAKAPASRYPSADELAADIGRFLDGRPIIARRVGVFEKAWRWGRRRPVAAGVVLLVVALLMAIGLVSVLLLRVNGEAQSSSVYTRELLFREETIRQAIWRENQRSGNDSEVKVRGLLAALRDRTLPFIYKDVARDLMRKDDLVLAALNRMGRESAPFVPAIVVLLSQQGRASGMHVALRDDVLMVVCSGESVGPGQPGGLVDWRGVKLLDGFWTDDRPPLESDLLDDRRAGNFVLMEHLKQVWGEVVRSAGMNNWTPVEALARSADGDDAAVRVLALWSLRVVAPFFKQRIDYEHREMVELGTSSRGVKREIWGQPIDSDDLERTLLPVLVKRLSDPVPSVRGLAALTLKELGHYARDAAGPLTAAASDADADMRLIALLTLGEIAPKALGQLRPAEEGAVVTLVSALDDRGQSLEVRIAAARALALIGTCSDRVVRALQDTLRDGPLPLKESAVEALGRLGPAAVSAASELSATARSEKTPPNLRQKAFVAAARVDDHQMSAVLDQLRAKLEEALEREFTSDKTITLVETAGSLGASAAPLRAVLVKLRDKTRSEIHECELLRNPTYARDHRTMRAMAAGQYFPLIKLSSATDEALKRIGPDPRTVGPPAKP